MPVEKKYYQWTVVALLFGVAFLNYMDRQMLTTMRPAIEVDIRELESATNFGYLMGIFLWVYGFVSPIAGIFADRFSRKWLIIISLFIWSAVTFFMGYVTTFTGLYWLRALMGISEAVYIPTALSLIAEYHQNKTRSLAIGIHMIGIYLGQASGGYGAVIADAITWQSAFHFFGMAGLVYAFVLVIFLKDKRMGEAPGKIIGVLQRPPVRTTIVFLFTSIPFWIILFYFAVPSLPGWAVKNWLPTLFSENLGVSMSVAGPFATLSIAISSFVGVLIGGVLSDKWAQKNLKGRIYTSVIGLGLTIPSLFLLGYGHTLFHVVSAAICFGIGWGMYDTNNMPILCQFVSSRRRATAYGIMNMTGVFSGAFITDLLGRSTDAGHLGRDLSLLSVIVAIAIVIMLVFMNPKVNDYNEIEFVKSK